jgi:hypothetical protein
LNLLKLTHPTHKNDNKYLMIEFFNTHTIFITYCIQNLHIHKLYQVSCIHTCIYYLTVIYYLIKNKIVNIYSKCACVLNVKIINIIHICVFYVNIELCIYIYIYIYIYIV